MPSWLDPLRDSLTRRADRIGLMFSERLDAEPTRQPCQFCLAMLTWRCARGPDGLVRRILLLLDLVDSEAFEELDPAWSFVDRGNIDRALMIGGDGELPSSITVRCLTKTCRRSYTQAWVYERGFETWTVTVD